MSGAPSPGTRVVRACDAVESLITGAARREIVETAARSQPFGRALTVLADGMRAHVWRAGTATVRLDALIGALDQATVADGFHVLHDWDGKANRFTEHTIAVDVAEYVAGVRARDATDRAALAIALDYYFVYVLSLIAMRAWDTTAPGETLDRVTRLLGVLQGPDGSGQPFAANAETLMLIATAHYEPRDDAYDALLARVRALPAANRTELALLHGPAMGCHLRFGFEVTYGRDVELMRRDNVADYPWLSFALVGIAEELDRLVRAGTSGPARDRAVEALLNALTPDPGAFLGPLPRALESIAADHAQFTQVFARLRPAVDAVLEDFRPRESAYSPLSLFLNFSHNVLKGIVVDAMLRGTPRPVTLNDLFTALPSESDGHAGRAEVARTLMAYARANPDTIRGRATPVIVYDPIAGRNSFGGVRRALRRT